MYRKMGSAIAVLIAVVVLVGGFAGFFTASVPTGHTGIPVTWGKVADYTVDAGFLLKGPFTRIVTMDNREQKAQFETQAFSKDIQQVEVMGSLNYSIDKTNAMTLYKEVGTNYLDTVVTPRLLETLKATFSEFTAENLVAERSQLSGMIKLNLQHEMIEKGINIININIENIDFTDAFTNAVEEKQVAQQTKLRIQTEESTKTAQKEAEAKRAIIQANADAEIARIQAESNQYAGEKEAEKNKKLAASLTDELVRYQYAQKWNGVLPAYSGGDNIPIIDLRPGAQQQNP